MKTLNSIFAVNLAVSNRCTANCIYCPKDRGESATNTLMGLDTFNIIVRRMIDEDIIARYGLRTIRLGENGDLFLNANSITMLRTIRARFPRIHIELFNHFLMARRDIADVVLRERLVDAIYMNIDGVFEMYHLIKKVNFDAVISNLAYFIKARDSLGLSIPVHVRALTLKNYVETLSNNFNSYPSQLSDRTLKPRDDFHEIKTYVNKILNPGLDSFKKTYPALWSEREALKNKLTNIKAYACPHLFRIQTEIYISPDGKWYLCCLDSKQELIIGDLTKESFADLINSETRKNYISNLIHRDYLKNGGPCGTVHCCQLYHKNNFISQCIKSMTGYSHVINRIYHLWRK